MEIKEKIEQVIDKAKNDEKFHKELKENPVKAIEDLLGVDLPDEQVKAIAEGVKAKISLDSAKGVFHNIEDAVEGFIHPKK